MTEDNHANDDLADMKAKMREALDRKNAKAKGVAEDKPLQEKAHGSEVVGGGPKMHRRKAGGGGSGGAQRGRDRGVVSRHPAQARAPSGIGSQKAISR